MFYKQWVVQALVTYRWMMYKKTTVAFTIPFLFHFLLFIYSRYARINLRKCTFNEITQDLHFPPEMPLLHQHHQLQSARQRSRFALFDLLWLVSVGTITPSIVLRSPYTFRNREQQKLFVTNLFQKKFYASSISIRYALKWVTLNVI